MPDVTWRPCCILVMGVAWALGLGHALDHAPPCPPLPQDLAQMALPRYEGCHLATYSGNVTYRPPRSDYKTRQILGHRVYLSAPTRDGKGGAFLWKEFMTDPYHIQQLRTEEGDFILDLGANLGLVAILLAKTHPSATILSFEPMPANFYYLRKNLKMNKVTNVIPFNLAIGRDHKLLETFYVPGWPPASGAYAGWQGTKLTVTVPTVPLHHVLRDYKLDAALRRVVALKMDCEGCEWELVPFVSPAVRLRLGAIPVMGELHPSMLPEWLTQEQYVDTVQLMCCQEGRPFGYSVELCNVPIVHPFFHKMRGPRCMAPSKGQLKPFPAGCGSYRGPYEGVVECR